MTTPSLDRLAKPYTGKLLSLDPGGTTGWSYFNGLMRIEWGQKPISNMEEFLERYEIDHLVCEGYVIYKGKEKVQGSLLTPRLIGQVEAFALHADIPLTKQLAVSVKRFCSDEKLKDWGLYVPGRPHATDSTRHACYWLIFRKDSS